MNNLRPFEKLVLDKLLAGEHRILELLRLQASDAVELMSNEGLQWTVDPVAGLLACPR